RSEYGIAKHDAHDEQANAQLLRVGRRNDIPAAIARSCQSQPLGAGSADRGFAARHPAQVEVDVRCSENVEIHTFRIDHEYPADLDVLRRKQSHLGALMIVAQHGIGRDTKGFHLGPGWEALHFRWRRARTTEQRAECENGCCGSKTSM